MNKGIPALHVRSIRYSTRGAEVRIQRELLATNHKGLENDFCEVASSGDGLEQVANQSDIKKMRGLTSSSVVQSQ
jgi:hypothetical protein